MANNYSPPSTINYFTSGFTSNVIFYDAQINSSFILTDTTSATFVNVGCYSANIINVPVAGQYLVTTNVNVLSNTNAVTASYQLLFTQAGQSNIDVSDLGMEIFCPTAEQTVAGSFSRLVTFPTAGNWSLTLQWASDGTHVIITPGSDFGVWVTVVHGVNPMNTVNQQLTQFVNDDYTLMTNVDTNAWWGNLTNAAVVEYGNSIITNTNGISSLNSQVNTLSTNVNNLQTDVNSLTSLSTSSGGIRIKP
jgi:hypothetical protein